MILLALLHASPLDAHFQWEYQALVLLAIAGLWLFLAGRAERRRDTAGSGRSGSRPPTDGETVAEC